MTKRISALVGMALLVVAGSACSNDPTVNPSGNTTNGSNLSFIQIDRIGRPGIKELYLPYAQHDPFNRIAPQQDGAQTAPLIGTFVTGTGGRSTAIGQYVAALLTPDVLVANLLDPNQTASYLGWETGGQIDDDCTLGAGARSTAAAGSTPATHTFGGRGLNDDVVSTMLGLTFGNLATNTALTAATPNVGLAPPADDAREQNGLNGTPNLINQNVTCTGKGFMTGRFPYLANPI